MPGEIPNVNQQFSDRKQQENMTHKEEIIPLGRTNSELTSMLELSNRNTKTNCIPCIQNVCRHGRYFKNLKTLIKFIKFKIKKLDTINCKKMN